MKFVNNTILISMLLLFISIASANAQWSTSPLINNAICKAANLQQNVKMISDGSGGVIMAWEDTRSGSNDIYAQKINSIGIVEWTTNGVVICFAVNSQFNIQLTSDGAGGAIITWEDLRTGWNNIYTQKINSSGVIQWAVNGVAISTGANSKNEPQLTSDGAGGAIITWYDDRSGLGSDIYAQKINSSGIVQWTVNGIPICISADIQSLPQIVSDGAGGAILVWRDIRGGVDFDIYAQKINSNGIVQWTVNGEAITTALVSQDFPQIVSDGSAGAIITWTDTRSGFQDIYAQKINSNGVVQWTADGVAICAANNLQLTPQIVSDGNGGAIITWDDARSGINDIYAQRINTSGIVQWTADGAPISTATNLQRFPQLVSDGVGGAIITWEDKRTGINDIYAQRINSSGSVQWTTDGVPISIASNIQSSPKISSDNLGGAIFTWQDTRNGISDIYSQKVNSEGMLGNAPVLTTSTIASITGTSATGGGNVTSDGSAAVTARGIVWSTSPSPTIALSTKTSDGTGTGEFTSSITGLTTGITYYVRAYATSSVGTSYGSEVTFTSLSNEQVVESNAPNNGDGNGDGLLDLNQVDVVSVFNSYTKKYITIVSLDGYTISGAEVQFPNDVLYHFPGSLVTFTIAHSSARVKIYYHGVTSLTGYTFKKLNSNNTLFNFTNYTFGSEEIDGKTVATATLTLTDGGPEDYDGVVNGSITDPGGPAILASNANIPMLSEWSRVFLISLLIAFYIWRVKKGV